MNLKRTPVKPLKAEFRRVLDPAIITNGLTSAFPTVVTFYKSWEKTYDIMAFIRRAAPLQMVSDMRRTRRQVLYAGKAGDARYPSQRHSFSKSTTSEWPLASGWSPGQLITVAAMTDRIEGSTATQEYGRVVNEECSKYVTLDKKLIQSSLFYFSDDDHSVDKVTIPSKVHNMEEAGPSVTEKPTNRSLCLKVALENADYDTMIVAPSVRDLDHLAEVSRMRQV
ncbi:DNA-directed RNA polymerases IV and V subunit 2-like protein [Tanacetum coccineum]